jgi:hypothetical protein
VLAGHDKSSWSRSSIATSPTRELADAHGTRIHDDASAGAPEADAAAGDAARASRARQR